MSTGRRGGTDSYIVLSGGDGDPLVLAGTVDPSAAAGIAAPEGSSFLRYVATAGEMWLKTGAADTAWTNVLGGGAPILAFFGNADNGSDVLAGDLGPDAEWWYQNLDTAGFDVQVERLFCRGTLTVRNGSHIHQNGADAVAAAKGTARVNRVTGAGADGGAGKVAAGDAGSDSSTTTGWGGDAGAGGQGTVASPGGAAGVSNLGTWETRPFSLMELSTGRATGQTSGPGYAYIRGGGGGGGGGGDGDEPGEFGGGGGAGGAIQIICARHIIVEAGGFIEANGGDGANGAAANCGGGGGGGGGAVLLLYETLVNNGTIQAAGGAKGLSGGGTGADGADGGVAYLNGIYQLATI